MAFIMEDEQMGFVNVMVLQLIQHMETCGGELNAIDVAPLKNEQEAPYEITKNPTQ